MSQRQRHNRTAGAEHATRFDGAGHQRAVGRGDKRGIVQVEFSLRQGRLRLFKAGFGWAISCGRLPARYWRSLSCADFSVA